MPNKTQEKWEEKTLKQLSVLICDGDWIESKNQSLSGIRLIQTGNVGNGFYKNKLENSRYISEETFKQLNCTEIYSGDCLVSRLPEPLGRACIIPERNERMITAVDCSIIRFNNKSIVPKYFIYYSMSNNYHNKVKKLSTGSTRQRISRKNLETITIPIPPLEEQERIVKILDKTFENIDQAKKNVEQNLNNAKELFESYLDKVFTENIKYWKSNTLIEVSKNITDGSHFSPKSYDNERFPYITVRDIDEQDTVDFKHCKFINEKDYEILKNNGCKPNLGDILFSKDGTVGKVSLVNYEKDFVVLSSLAIISPDNSIINSKFLMYVLKTPKFLSTAIGKKTGVAIRRIILKNLKTISIYYPQSIEEQQKIVQQLDELQEQTKQLEKIYEQKIKDLDELKQSILQKAFNGEL